MATHRGRARGPIDDELRRLGLAREVLTTVPSFGIAVALVLQSEATTLLPRRLARVFVDAGALATVILPVPLPPVPVSQIWHASRGRDPEPRWLRALVRGVAAGEP